MPSPEQVPRFVAGVTVIAGGALLASPGLATGPLGLEGQASAVRALGLADLVLVPGLWGAHRASPWMAARCALSLAQGAYLDGIAPRTRRPALARAGALVLAGLAVADAATALQLRRAGR